jgi:hypothetical protein
MTNTDRIQVTPISTTPAETRENFTKVAVPTLPNCTEGVRNALKMLQDSQQPPGEYLVVLRMNGEPLPGIFVAAGATEAPRHFLEGRLKELFPDLKMGADIFSMAVTLEK